MRAKSILTWVSVILILIPTTTSSLAYRDVMHPAPVGNLVSPGHTLEQSNNNEWSWIRFIMGFIVGTILSIIIGNILYEWWHATHQGNETLLC